MESSSFPGHQLAVAADYTPNLEIGLGRVKIRKQVLRLADKLYGTGVILKIHSILRACGYGLIHEIHKRDLKVMVDLKLHDTSRSLAHDGEYLSEFAPEIVTVACAAGIKSMRALKARLPSTEVVGITVLTEHGVTEANSIYRAGVEHSVIRLADLAMKAGLDGVVVAPAEASRIARNTPPNFSINTPDIREENVGVLRDIQNPKRGMTPEAAIQAGATRLIVGQPIINDPDPRQVVMRYLEKIARANERLARMAASEGR